jgi:phosphopantothenoylcysteine decarboxylase/phosphopantothenate--cysteine ligase
VRRLQEAGADVRVVMTSAATAFVMPLTFQALSGNPVHTDLLDPQAEAGMGHIALARWADFVLIAPASADFIAQLANGFANNLLATVCLATVAPIAIAPAMNQGMWANRATQHNMNTLIERGFLQFGPGEGAQACGDQGEGRMLEPLALLDACVQYFSTGLLAEKRVLITAGPTREALDPVRYISNNSSGKMGFALAQAARQAGAQVTLVVGPVHLETPPGCERVNVMSALEMHESVLALSQHCDIFIAAAAVADYRPVDRAEQKIKKSSDELSITFTKNPDIVADVANAAHRPFTVGFAAETQDVVRYGQEKLNRKHLDMIVVNDVSRQDIGFDSDQNAVIVMSDHQQVQLDIANKLHIAQQIIALIADKFKSLD